MDCNLPGSSVHGILQARTLEWVAMPSSGDLPGPGVEPGSPMSPTLAGFFSTSVTRKAHWNGDIEAKTTMLSWLCFYLACSSVQGTVWVSVSLSVKQVILGLLRLSGVIRIT